MKTRIVSAAEFKAECFALLDEIEQAGGPITITRASKARIVGDIVNLDASGLWEALSP